MRRIEAAVWPDAVAACIAEGFSHFVTLMAIDDDGLALWLRLRNVDGVDAVLAVDASTAVASIVGLFAEASWSEREAAEMYGIRFVGHAVDPLLLPANTDPPMLKAALLPARQSTDWPGEKDPGGVTARRRTLPPGVAGAAR